MIRKTYTSMIPTGVDYLEDVPTSWELTRLGRVTSCLDGQRIPLNAEERSYRVGSVPYWGANSIVDYVDRHLFDEELILLGEDGAPFFDPLKPVAFRSLGPIWPNNHVHVLRAVDNIVTGFLVYALNAVNYRAYIDGSTRDKLTQEKMRQIVLALPSCNEQHAIAAFLDRETAKIDALIAEQERLIALLQEKRQAVISQAVTKGLDPTVPMKDSGVGWLGEIPEHWTAAHIKRLCREITDGAHVSPETDNGIHDFVSTRDLGEEEIRFDDCLKTSDESYDYLVKTGCRPFAGDILFSKDGTIGKTVLVMTSHPFVVASSLIIIRPDHERIDKDFLKWLLRSSVVVRQIDQFVRGAGLPRLSIANLLRVIGVFPPREEQGRIADYLNVEMQKSTVLIEAAERLIELLKERRAALISAAVTGKIDVREAVGAEPAEAA